MFMYTVYLYIKQNSGTEVTQHSKGGKRKFQDIWKSVVVTHL